MVNRCLAVAMVLAGCGRQPTSVAEAGPTLDVAWTGHYTGRFTASARASWCAVDSMVQIFAIRGDTGVGLALFVEDTVRVAQHPVLSPEVVVPWRPLGTAAVRWVGDADIVGYQAVSGVISVTAVDSGLSGTVDVGLRVPGGVDTMHLAGEFTAIPIEPAEGSCGRFEKARKEGQ